MAESIRKKELEYWSKTSSFSDDKFRRKIEHKIFLKNLKWSHYNFLILLIINFHVLLVPLHSTLPQSTVCTIAVRNHKLVDYLKWEYVLFSFHIYICHWPEITGPPFCKNNKIYYNFQLFTSWYLMDVVIRVEALWRHL